MSAVIGIDLGTSTTEAAVFRDGKAEMILNFEGEAVTPSAVGIDRNGGWVAGARAKTQYLLEPQQTAIEVKRKTGTGETIRLGRTEYQPVELQAKLLTHVRTYASEYMGENVDRAVISVPAYFDNLQRLETLIAGENAGFTVERIINEPTAAALCYGLDHMEEESYALVYDLGGGTFDVTLLEMFEGVMEVRASSGDNQLGGKDFDERLIDMLLSRFAAKYGKNLRTDIHAMARIKEAAEKCKIALSTETLYRVALPAISTVNGAPAELDETVTREEFEEMTRDLLERTHGPLDTIFEDAGLTADQISEVILVGGSTRMPMVAEDIRSHLGLDPREAVHPDYAVAMGAAIQAGIISGEIEPEEGIVMTDVCPYTLGIQTNNDGEGNAMSVIIPRNTTIPCSRTERYCTSQHGQTSAEIVVFQGESVKADQNHYLGEFTIDGIPKGPQGKEKIDVRFAYDLNGLLDVTAVLCSNGKDMTVRIDTKNGSNETDISGWKKAPLAQEYRARIRAAERFLKKEGLPVGTRERVQKAIRTLQEEILLNRAADAADADENLSMLIYRHGGRDES